MTTYCSELYDVCRQYVVDDDDPHASLSLSACCSGVVDVIFGSLGDYSRTWTVMVLKGCYIPIESKVVRIISNNLYKYIPGTHDNAAARQHLEPGLI